eukprot:5372924-Prymnesium_polylepis.1
MSVGVRVADPRPQIHNARTSIPCSEGTHGAAQRKGAPRAQRHSHGGRARQRCARRPCRTPRVRARPAAAPSLN